MIRNKITQIIKLIPNFENFFKNLIILFLFQNIEFYLLISSNFKIKYYSIFYYNYLFTKVVFFN